MEAALRAQNAGLMGRLNELVKSGPALGFRVPVPAMEAALRAQNAGLMGRLNELVKSGPALGFRVPTPALDAALRIQRTQFRAALGSLNTATTYRMVLASPQSLQAAAIDAALEDLEQAVQRADRQTGSQVPLLAIWAQSLRDFGAWMREPVVTWSSVMLVWFVVAYWWVTLKSERPDVADMVEVPFTLLAGVVLGAAVAKTTKRK
jgi:hypothetical protein